MPVITQTADIQNTRHLVRRRLDDEPDFIVVESNVTFRQSFETVELVETYARAPGNHRSDKKYSDGRNTRLCSKGCQRLDLLFGRVQQDSPLHQRPQRTRKDAFRI